MKEKSFKEMAFPVYSQNNYSVSIQGGVNKGELVAAMLYAINPSIGAEKCIKLSKDFWGTVDAAHGLEQDK